MKKLLSFFLLCAVCVHAGPSYSIRMSNTGICSVHFTNVTYTSSSCGTVSTPQSADLASGASFDFPWANLGGGTPGVNDGSKCTYNVTYTGVDASGAGVSSSTATLNGNTTGTGFIVTATVSGSCVSCVTNVQFKLRNNNPTETTYETVAILNGVVSHTMFGMDVPVNYQTVAPGNFYNVVISGVPCTNATLLDVCVVSYTGSVADGTAHENVIPLGATPLPSPTAPVPIQTTPVPIQAAPVNLTNILWSATNANDTFGVISAVKDVGKTLYDSGTKIGVQAHGDASKLHDDLSGIKTTLDAINGKTGASNGVSVTVGVTNNIAFTNYATETTMSNLVGVGVSNLISGAQSGHTLVGISNLLAGFSTNSGGTNVLAVPSVSTNDALALSAATAAEGDYGVDGLISQFTPSMPGGAGTPNMTMEFCGQTIDLDPNHIIPGASPMCLLGWRIILLLAFIFEVARMFWKVVEIKASAETGGVPDLEASIGASFLGVGGTVGGNAAGVAVALLVPITFIALFTTAMAYLFSHLGIEIGDAFNIGAWTSSMGAIGYYLLSSFFPVNLFFTLIFTRITLSFTLAKIVALASDASRFLFGK